MSENLRGSKCPTDLFSAMKEHLTTLLDSRYMKQFSVRYSLWKEGGGGVLGGLPSPHFSDEYVRYCQWKYMELLVPEQVRG